MRNINKDTDEEIESRYTVDENLKDLISDKEVAKEMSPEDLISEVYLCLSDMLFFINSNGYWMIHREEEAQ